MKSKSACHLKILSALCFILGFASILGSILVWVNQRGDTLESIAHAERFGIFIGLWAPTFFILSNRFDRYADKACCVDKDHDSSKSSCCV